MWNRMYIYVKSIIILRVGKYIQYENFTTVHYFSVNCLFLLIFVGGGTSCLIVSFLIVFSIAFIVSVVTFITADFYFLGGPIKKNNNKTNKNKKKKTQVFLLMYTILDYCLLVLRIWISILFDFYNIVIVVCFVLLFSYHRNKNMYKYFA